MSEHVVTTRFASQGVDELMRDNTQIIGRIQELRQAGGDYKDELDDLSLTMKRNNADVFALRRGYMGLRTDVRVANMPLIQTTQLLSSIGSMGLKAMSVWQSYTVGMIRVEQAQRGHSEAVKDLAHWQDVANRYLREFGADSSYYMEAKSMVDKLTQSEKEAAEAIERAKGEQVGFFATFALSVPSFIADIGRIIIQWQTTRKVIAAANYEQKLMSLGGVATGAGGTTAAAAGVGIIGGVVAGVAGTVVGAYDISEKTARAYREQTGQEIGIGGQAVAALSNLSGTGLLQALGGLFGVDTINAFNADKLSGLSVDQLNQILKRSDVPDYVKNVVRQQQQAMSVSVTQYNNITNVADGKKAADEAYKQLLDKFKKGGS